MTLEARSDEVTGEWTIDHGPAVLRQLTRRCPVCDSKVVSYTLGDIELGNRHDATQLLWTAMSIVESRPTP